MNLVNLKAEPRRLTEVLARYRGREDNAGARAAEIVAAVRRDGDEAVTTFTRQFDCRFVDSLGLRVSPREQSAARKMVPSGFLTSLRVAAKNIVRYHKQQIPKSYTVKEKGVRLEYRPAALSRVGMCIPGGKRAYPLDVLMMGVPARMAGVKDLVLTARADEEGRVAAGTLVAAAECGIDEIYRMGGAQSVAALAFGTESIRRVDKIVGRGDPGARAAMKSVFGEVGVQVVDWSPETVFLADAGAQHDRIAADMLVLAGSDEASAPVLLTTSTLAAEQVSRRLRILLDKSELSPGARRGVRQEGTIIVAGNLRHAIGIVNELAPATLVLRVKDAKRILSRIRNAGTIIAGELPLHGATWSHTGMNFLSPTGGMARFNSPVGVADFIRHTQIALVARKLRQHPPRL